MPPLPKKVNPEERITGLVTALTLNQLIDWAHGVEERLKPDAQIAQGYALINGQVVKHDESKPPRLKYEPFLSAGRYVVDPIKGGYKTFHEVVIKFDTKEQAEAYRNQLLARGTHTPDRPLNEERE